MSSFHRLALRCSEPRQESRAAFVGRAFHGASWKRRLDASLEAARVGGVDRPQAGMLSGG